MPSEAVVRLLSPAQREMLIAHIDAALDVTTDQTQHVRAALMKAGFLRGHPFGAARPRLTVLTTEGRYAVGMILGSYADALVRAGLLEQENPLNALQALREMRAGGRPQPQKLQEVLPPRLRQAARPQR